MGSNRQLQAGRQTAAAAAAAAALVVARGQLHPCRQAFIYHIWLLGRKKTLSRHDDDDDASTHSVGDFGFSWLV